MIVNEPSLKSILHYCNNEFDFENRTFPTWFKCGATIQPAEVCTYTHNHTHIEILRFKSGNFLFNINGTEYCLSKGDILIINPIDVHTGIVFTNTAASYDMVQLNILDLSNCGFPEIVNLSNQLVCKEVKFHHLIQVKNPANRDLSKIIDNLIISFNESEICRQLDIYSYILLFFSALIKNGYMHTAKTLPSCNKFVEKVSDFIDKHYNEQISTQEIAEHLSYDKSYFCRNFKKYYHQSFSNYLKWYRITVSLRYTTNSNISIAEIAKAIGFNNYSYFFYAFKEQIGISPTDYFIRQKKYGNSYRQNDIEQSATLLKGT